jgi:hypothetical protein
MSFELFVGICLVACWALLPASIALAVKQYEDALYDDGHGHDDHKDHKDHH